MTTDTRRDHKRPTADQSLALWAEYKASGDLSLRNRLVLTYVPLVKHIVYKKLRELPASCEVEDLISCGIESLIPAIDRYDPAKGAALEPYLWTRIHGSVLDELRRRDWAPRSLRRLERDIKQAREMFTGVHGRPPNREELADALNLTASQLRGKEQEIQNSDLTSLSSLVVTEGETAIELIDTLQTEDMSTDPEHVAGWDEAKDKFRHAFEQLPPREREVAVLLYVKNLTLREIGEVLEVSESRVSQIHSQLKRRIRERLHAETLLFSEVA
ncbi:MAG TPA: FliA/WhiG family RNA polymerase sigma factor [Thermoleophilaceae bacterium]|nr:FliA/WhiG family RNA polymerase sigma factor [Thermoleophilaceae bacterium]